MLNIVLIHAIEEKTMKMNTDKKKMKAFARVRDFCEKRNKMIVFATFFITVSFGFINLHAAGALTLTEWVFIIALTAAFAFGAYTFGSLLLMYADEGFNLRHDDFVKSLKTQSDLIDLAIDKDAFYQAVSADHDIIYSFEKLSELAFAHPRKW